MKIKLPVIILFGLLGLTGRNHAQDAVSKPSIFVCGDSTAKNSGNGKSGEPVAGWGTPIAGFFDSEKVVIKNVGHAGTSSRTYYDGDWPNVLPQIKAGDLVLLVFGINDGSTPPGLGDEVVTQNDKPVHTYGWYMSKMATDAREKGAHVYLLTVTTRNIWSNPKVRFTDATPDGPLPADYDPRQDRIERGTGNGRFTQWTKDVGQRLHFPVFDLTNFCADQYEVMGREAVNRFYSDHNHTYLPGAQFVASSIVSGLKAFKTSPFIPLLSAKGKAVETAAAKYVGENLIQVADVPTSTQMGSPPAPEGAPGNGRYFPPTPANPNLPTLWIIGDSTVRNGTLGDGSNMEQWGWGAPIVAYFDLGKINVVNRAFGGTSSRSFYTGFFWQNLRPQIKKGDVVLLQFGANDNGGAAGRGALRGIGAETENNVSNGTTEIVHTFGWYLRQFVRETREQAGIPIIVSLTPRKAWTSDGHFQRDNTTHAAWAAEVAKQDNVLFVDLYELIARRYETLGPAKVDSLYVPSPTERLHTGWDGAVINADVLIAGLKQLPDNPLAAYLRARGGEGNMKIRTISLTVALLPMLGFAAARPQTSKTVASAVSVTENGDSFTLSNGIVTARVLKSNGDIRSLQYKGTEILTDRSGHAGGYWSHDTTGGKAIVTKVTIDPAGNGGERAEVSIKGISGGVKMGHGPGAAADGDFPADIEIRYALGRGDSGIYTYCIFDHRPEYAAATMTEARFAVKLADFFDWMSIDAQRNKYYPQEIPGEDKYVYTALQSENRAYGFSSTKRNIGFYFINPSVEYLSGGPTKPEFLDHRDTTPVQAPVVLNYWRSSHYGGANVTVAAGEQWTKVIGPFLLYLNEGPDPMAMWKEARARADMEAAKWPYGFVDAGNYAKPGERSTVKGRLTLKDTLIKKFPGGISVGLAQPAAWQTDAKHYQFWARSNNADGTFSIPKVSPGAYTLYAFADGVLGEFSKANIQVGPGRTVDLGELTWEPVRRGRQVWEIGVPNRTGAEFAGGDRFFEPDITLQYPKIFPTDVTYTIGESQHAKDWFYAHVPHNTDPKAQVEPFRGVVSNGRETPYTIRFRMDAAGRGTAVLRLAICGTGTRTINVSVNGNPAGQVQLGPGDGVITRHQVQGLWYERQFEFDASTLKAGENTLTMTVPAGPVNNGVVYDYLRLEL